MSTATIAAASWVARAVCRTMPDYWSAEPRTDAVSRATAQHICQRHCPVLRECLAEVLAARTTEARYTHVVVAGLDLNHEGRPKDRLGRARARVDCPICGPLRPPRAAGPVHGSDRAVRDHLDAGEALCGDCATSQRYRLKLKAQGRAQRIRKKARKEAIPS